MCLGILGDAYGCAGLHVEALVAFRSIRLQKTGSARCKTTRSERCKQRDRNDGKRQDPNNGGRRNQNESSMQNDTIRTMENQTTKMIQNDAIQISKKQPHFQPDSGCTQNLGMYRNSLRFQEHWRMFEECQNISRNHWEYVGMLGNSQGCIGIFMNI